MDGRLIRGRGLKNSSARMIEDHRRSGGWFLAILLLGPWQTPAVPVPLDLTLVRPGPISVVRNEASVFFTTTGEVLLPDVDLGSSSATEIVARSPDPS